MSESRTVAPETFRRVLGQFPTGVAVITAMGLDGRPVGMAIGSFTSVSLEPPLVGFLPAATSKTWPQIEATGRFCVNILSAQQESLCRTFSRSGEDKFANVSWFESAKGVPILRDSLGWIECEIARVDPAGDHFMVLGSVADMQVQSESMPLVFFRGGYGGFRPGALVAGDPQGDLGVPLRIVDLGRQDIDSLAHRWNTPCAVTALVGDQIVVLAVANAIGSDGSSAFIGGRNRAIPPLGSTFMAWEPEDRVADWLALAPAPEDRQNLLTRLQEMRNRGFAVSLEGGSVQDWEHVMSGAAESDPARRDLLTAMTSSFNAPFETTEAEHVRNVHVPVLGPDGRVGVTLNVGGFPPLNTKELADLITDIQQVAGRISARCGGPGLDQGGGSAGGPMAEE